MKISLIIDSLDGGGAERVAVNMINHWYSNGYDVELVLLKHQGEILGELHSDILIKNLNCRRFKHFPIKLASYLRQRMPDITIVHMWPLTSLSVLAWYFAGKPGKLYLTEHTVISEHVRRDLNIPLSLVAICLRISHHQATGVIAVSVGVANDIATLACLRNSAVHVIYNPVVTTPLRSSVSLSDYQLRRNLWNGSYNCCLLSIGSLKKSKNHQLLLNAFAKVFTKLDAALVILGEGPERFSLECLVQELGLEGRVILPGFQSNPETWIKQADLLVLSSDFEGLPTVLIESLACGTPVLSTDCPHGPSEILENGRYGVLVPVNDEHALATGIHLALECCWDSLALQSRALDFGIPCQAEAYLHLFKSNIN